MLVTNVLDRKQTDRHPKSMQPFMSRWTVLTGSQNVFVCVCTLEEFFRAWESLRLLKREHILTALQVKANWLVNSQSQNVFWLRSPVKSEWILAPRSQNEFRLRSQAKSEWILAVQSSKVRRNSEFSNPVGWHLVDYIGLQPELILAAQSCKVKMNSGCAQSSKVRIHSGCAQSSKVRIDSGCRLLESTKCHPKGFMKSKWILAARSQAKSESILAARSQAKSESILSADF